jgi:alanine racemase
MDQCSVDLSPVPSAREGDEVVLIGTQRGTTLTADAIAEASGTISYEILVGFGRRLPRRYVGGPTDGPEVA